MDGQEVVGRLNARALLTSTERRSLNCGSAPPPLHGATIPSAGRPLLIMMLLIMMLTFAWPLRSVGSGLPFMSDDCAEPHFASGARALSPQLSLRGAKTALPEPTPANSLDR